MKISNREMRSFAWKYVRKYLGKELVILLLILGRNAGTLSFPYLLKIIIDDVFRSWNEELLWKILLIVVGTQLLSTIAGIYSTYFQQQVSNQIMKDIRTDLFTHVIHLPVDFYNKNDIGEVIHSLSNEVNIIRRFLTSSFVEMINNLIMIVCIALILIILDPFLFQVSIIFIPALIILVTLFHTRIRISMGEDRKADASIMSFMIEKLQNVILVKLSRKL